MKKKASELFRVYQNPNGPAITTVSRTVLERDGLFFKDLDGSGEFKFFDDWRLPAEERAAALVSELTVDEKLGQIFVSDWRMGKDSGKLNPMQQRMGMTITEFLLDYRLSKAAQRLTLTRMSITSIAHAVGFHSASKFSEEFRKKTGQTPSAYRKSADRQSGQA